MIASTSRRMRRRVVARRPPCRSSGRVSPDRSFRTGPATSRFRSVHRQSSNHAEGSSWVRRSSRSCRSERGSSALRAQPSRWRARSVLRLRFARSAEFVTFQKAEQSPARHRLYPMSYRSDAQGDSAFFNADSATINTRFRVRDATFARSAAGDGSMVTPGEFVVVASQLVDDRDRRKVMHRDRFAIDAPRVAPHCDEVISHESLRRIQRAGKPSLRDHLRAPRDVDPFPCEPGAIQSRFPARTDGHSDVREY